MSAKPLDGDWMDEWGSCRVCGGEIPHGHQRNCHIYKQEVAIDLLSRALTELIGSITSKGAPDTRSPIAWSGSPDQNHRMYDAIEQARKALVKAKA